MLEKAIKLQSRNLIEKTAGFSLLPQYVESSFFCTSSARTFTVMEYIANTYKPDFKSFGSFHVPIASKKEINLSGVELFAFYRNCIKPELPKSTAVLLD